MFRKFFTLIGTLGIVIGGIILISVMGSMRPQLETRDPEIVPPVVFYQIAQPQQVTLNVTAQGEVRPRTDINLTAQVAGRVIKTSDEFVNGGAFEKGDLLLKIEDIDYRASSASAKARVAQSLEALRREEAEATLARRDYDDLGRGEEASELTLRVPQLAQARANYEASQAEYRAALINLERTEIRAPFKGRVRERIAGVGQYVSPGAQLGRIFSTDIAEIRLPMTDSDIAKLGLSIAFVETLDNPGPPVRLSAMVAGQQHQWQARIARTDGAIDPATRLISAIAVVDDPYGAGADNGTPLIMGLFVNASIQGQPYDNAYVLSRSALYGRDVIYIINSDNTLQKRTVDIVSSDRDTITIASGLSPGDRVVTSPLRGAADGDEVNPTDPSVITPIADDDNEPDTPQSNLTPIANAGGNQ